MRVLSLPVLLLMASSAPAMAQVGHPPDQTPYRDLVPGHTFTPMAGYVGGSGGPLKLGPHAGMVYGARYDFRSNRNLGFALSVATGKLDRVPAAVIRGYPFVPGDGRATDLVRAAEMDLFR